MVKFIAVFYERDMATDHTVMTSQMVEAECIEQAEDYIRCIDDALSDLAVYAMIIRLYRH